MKTNEYNTPVKSGQRTENPAANCVSVSVPSRAPLNIRVHLERLMFSVVLGGARGGDVSPTPSAFIIAVS